MQFTAAELSGMATVQTAHMMDTGVLQAHSATQDAHGQQVDSYADGVAIPCGFGYAPLGRAPEVVLEDGTTVTVDAQVRLRVADGDAARAVDRFKLTHRFGEALNTPQVFEIVGLPRRGPSGIVLQLRKVDV